MADSKKYDGSQWEHSLRKLTTATEIIVPPTTIYADGSNITTYTIKGNTVQNGTPTPTNPVPVVGVGELETTGEHSGEYKIPISNGQQTTNIYLGSTQSTRQIEKIKLDELLWTYITTSSYSGFYIYNYTTDLIEAAGGYCNKLDVYTGAFTSAPNNSITIFESSVNQRLFIRYDDAQGDTTAFMTMLEGAVFYGVKTTPTTGIVNEPLMKIGDYADSISNAAQIPTTEGANSITVDTTVQPSEFSATWTGWHDSSVKEYDGSDWQ